MLDDCLRSGLSSLTEISSPRRRHGYLAFIARIADGAGKEDWRMLTGTCHCGEVSWTLDGLPTSVTACNCTICRRYGALWAYGYIGHEIRTTGKTSTYRRRDSGDILFHFCAICGCITHYVAVSAGEDGRYQAAVNVRMSDLSPIGGIPIRRFEGHDSFEALPPDGRTVKDVWF